VERDESMPIDPTDAEAYVSIVFDKVVGGDQVGADLLKAEVSGCYSFGIPRSLIESEEAALSYLDSVFQKLS
jgi:hypothetical protein